MRRLLFLAAAWIYRAYYATLDVRHIRPDGQGGRAQAYDMRAHVFAIREGDALALAGLMARRRFTVIVSHGRDGDWAAGLLMALGCRVLRGSTRRGGASALRAVMREVDASDTALGIVVDGPLGPAGVAKPGAVACARHGDRPLIALGVAVTRTFAFPRTWSGIHLPWPFARVMVAVQPSPVSGDVARETIELTANLARARDRAATTLRKSRRGAGRLARAARATGAGLRVGGDGLLAAVALPFLAPLWLLPWRSAAALGRWYGYAAWAVLPRARRVGAINLRRAFGTSMTSRKAGQSTRLVFGSLGQAVAEGVQFSRRIGRADEARPLYEVEDPGLEQRILNDPRPRIFVTGHLGSWEIATILAALRSARPGSVVVRGLDNRFLNALWQHVRVSHRADWIEKHGAAREAHDRLRHGEDVAMLLDENGGYRGVFVPFFGRPASTRKTPAVLSLATGAPVVVGVCIRRSDRPFLYRLALLEPDRSLPPDTAVRDLTARIVATYETWIRDAPLQWRWVHWRWKTRPDDTEETYTRAEVRRIFSEPDRPRTGAETEPPDLGWRTSRS